MLRKTCIKSKITDTPCPKPAEKQGNYGSSVNTLDICGAIETQTIDGKTFYIH